MDIWDHEGNCRNIYERARADMSDPPGAWGLARGLGYRLRYDARLRLGGAERCRIKNEPVIFVQRGLPMLVEAVRVFHEIAEGFLERSGLAEAEIERAADELAYHLRMPRPAFRGLVSVVGHDLRQLAEPWPASQTGAALRLLEVTDTPGAVITPREVRVRGPEWAWPAPEELRRLLQAERLPEGLERLVIDDRRGAGVLVAA